MLAKIYKIGYIRIVMDDRLKQALEGLTDRQKRRITAYYLQHQTQAQIAQAEQVKQPQIHKSIKAALKKMRKNRVYFTAIVE